MPRPPKKRLIENIPQVKYFKPAGVPRRELEEIEITLEEVEALRLKDKHGLTQEECAKKMEVSRPTFQRILVNAHEKIARALLEGKSIRFKGGDYKIAYGSYRCLNCGHTFHKSSGRRGPQHWRGCPRCGENSIRKQSRDDQ